MERRRNGSVASSKRSGTSPGATQANSSKVNATTSQSMQMQKPKKSGGFLGFLNCCGASDRANGAEDEVPIPVRRISKVGSQVSPQMTSSKPESIPLQLVTGQPTGSLPEKSAQRPPETVQEPVIDQEDVSQSSLRIKQENLQGNLDRKPSSKDFRNQPLPALPQEADKTPRDQNSSSNPSVIVQAPTPSRPKQEDAALLPGQDNASSDAEMADAPPITTEETKAVSAIQRDAQNNTTILPPPPPLPTPDTGKDSTNTSQDTNAAEPVEEKQQWLLPPIEPRFQGKKCLVLDLDETLVHSSFKVWSILD
jgi:carboxy-terminal domain RNA polymerase II polypeptide A small phosphatase